MATEPTPPAAPVTRTGPRPGKDATILQSAAVSVFTLGLNHTTAPLDLRGRFAFAPEQLAPVLRQFRQRLQRAMPEAALVSTCNRTELYVAAEPRAASELVRPAVEWLAEQGGVAPAQLQSFSYVREDREAARHAFRVASGLDSMVLGEPQILGQMKQAVRQAGEAGTLGCTLHQLFQRSFAVAKEVRTATEIGAHSVSMAAAAVRLAAQLFEDLREIRILFVGAGEMIELVATHFAARSPKSMALANRTLERGEKLAGRFGAEAMRLAELPTRLHEFDAVVSCTASTLPALSLKRQSIPEYLPWPSLPLSTTSMPTAANNFRSTSCRLNGTSLAPIPTKGWIRVVCFIRTGEAPNVLPNSSSETGITRQTGVWRNVFRTPVRGLASG